MNEAAELVTDALLGKYFKTCFLGGKAYSISNPNIKVILRGLNAWSKLNFNDDKQSLVSVIGQIPQNATHILKGLSIFIVGDVRFWKIKSFFLYRDLMNGRSPSPEEMLKAVDEIITLIQAKDFFECAALVKSVAKTAAEKQ